MLLIDTVQNVEILKRGISLLDIKEEDVLGVSTSIDRDYLKRVYDIFSLKGMTESYNYMVYDAELDIYFRNMRWY